MKLKRKTGLTRSGCSGFGPVKVFEHLQWWRYHSLSGQPLLRVHVLVAVLGNHLCSPRLDIVCVSVLGAPTAKLLVRECFVKGLLCKWISWPELVRGFQSEVRGRVPAGTTIALPSDSLGWVCSVFSVILEAFQRNVLRATCVLLCLGKHVVGLAGSVVLRGLEGSSRNGSAQGAGVAELVDCFASKQASSDDSGHGVWFCQKHVDPAAWGFPVLTVQVEEGQRSLVTWGAQHAVGG